MSGIPLVQNNEKDSINTSIIAIKRALERINQLLGLSDSGGSDPDLSGLATKQELQDAVNSLQPVDEVTLNNMQSVTSNAVSKAFSYSTTEHFTGKYWVDGKKIYEMTIYIASSVSQWSADTWSTVTTLAFDIDYFVSFKINTKISSVPYTYGIFMIRQTTGKVIQVFPVGQRCQGDRYLTLEYTKSTD